MNFLRRLFRRITGGRPMKYEGHAFIDWIAGSPVGYYTDLYNRVWLAESKWALFRVAVEGGQEFLEERRKFFRNLLEVENFETWSKPLFDVIERMLE